MPDLCHYTIQTGDIRRSPRSEVGDDVIEALRPLLVSGAHPVPRVDGFSVRVSTERRTLMATVSQGDAPLVTFAVAADRAGLAHVSELMRVPAGADVWLPACLVEVHPTIVLAQGVGWLGDYERCVAWAWVERCAGQ